MTYTNESDHASSDSQDEQSERHETTGDRLLETVRRLVREGNARRITIRNQDDEVVLTFPLSAGVVGAALLPVWAGSAPSPPSWGTAPSRWNGGPTAVFRRRTTTDRPSLRGRGLVR